MTKKSVVLSNIFFILNLIMIVYFREDINHTIYSTNNVIVYLSVMYLTLVILFTDKNYWCVLALIFYVRHVYFFYLVSFYIKNGLNIRLTLPYVMPAADSYAYASLIMFIEFMTVFIMYIIYKLKPKKRIKPQSDLHTDSDQHKISAKYKIYIICMIILLSSLLSSSFFTLVRYTYIMLLFFEVNDRILNVKTTKRRATIKIILNFIAVSLLLFDRNRKRVIYFGFAAFFYLRKMFPGLEKVIKRFIFVAVILFISILTTSRFSDIKLLDNLTNLDTFSNYFLTIDKVAAGLEVKELLDRTPLIQLIIDIVRPIIFLGPLFKLKNLEHGSLYFNKRISYGGLPRGDQIFPFSAQTSLVSPFIMVFIIILIIKALNYLHEKKYYDARMYFLAKYVSLILCLFSVINVTIIINTISFNILPLYLIIRLGKLSKRADF